MKQPDSIPVNLLAPYLPNGSSADHARGGVQFVMGGAVDKGKAYGKYPNQEIGTNDNANSDWSFSKGQYTPTTNVEQMMATSSRWLGVDTNQFDTIFPNPANFKDSDLGFMS